MPNAASLTSGLILLVEDDPAVRRSGEQAFSLAGFGVKTCVTAEQAISLLHDDFAGVVFSDVRLPGNSGLWLLRSAVAVDPEIPVILVTGHGDVSMAVEAMRAGAYDFIEKPFPTEHLIEVAKRALEKRHLVLENRELRHELSKHDAGTDLIGRSPAIEHVRHLIEALGPTSANVLVTGETGTGKEVVARALHRVSGRCGNFVALNCGAVPESVFESEMFGCEPGAFTGAAKRRVGKIEHANRGTLFLDEIESMPLPLQVKLLRVLQEQCVERLGGNDSYGVDLRVIAASKVDLKTIASEGKFRDDLYYRVNVASIDLPPLRARKDDIPQLFAFFAVQAGLRYGRPAAVWGAAEMERWLGYEWPGNVRELRNAAERAVLGVATADPPFAPVAESGSGALSDRVDLFERSLIEMELRRSGGSVARTAAALGLPKKTLYDKLHRHRLLADAFRVAG